MPTLGQKIEYFLEMTWEIIEYLPILIVKIIDYRRSGPIPCLEKKWGNSKFILFFYENPA